MTKFWEIFYERIDVLHDALLYRINRLKDAVPNNAPILYKSGAFNYKLKETDDVSFNSTKYGWLGPCTFDNFVT